MCTLHSFFFFFLRTRYILGKQGATINIGSRNFLVAFLLLGLIFLYSIISMRFGSLAVMLRCTFEVKPVVVGWEILVFNI